jgi:hypothetical protein
VPDTPEHGRHAGITVSSPHPRARLGGAVSPARGAARTHARRRTALAASTFALEEHLVSAPAHVGEALGFAFLSLCWWPSGIGWFLIGRPLQGGVSAIVRWASVVTLFAFALDLLSYIDCGRECHPDLRPLIGAFIVVCVWPLASAVCLTVTLIADALFPRISDD